MNSGSNGSNGTDNGMEDKGVENGFCCLALPWGLC